MRDEGRVDVDPADYATSYGYYSNGDVAEVTSPSGMVRSYGYDEIGRKVLESVTDPRGGAAYTTTTEFDVLGRPVKVTAPPVTITEAGQTPVTANPVTETGYDTWGSATHVKDPGGNVTVSTFDKLGRQVLVEYPTYVRPDLSGAGAYSVAVSADGPKHQWRLDEPLGSATATDDGTAASNGTFYNAPVLGYPSPVEGTSMLVDVWANKHMSHPILTDNTFSVEFLARLDDLSASTQVAVSNTSDEFNDGWFIRKGGAALTLQMESTTVIVHPHELVAGEWMHIVVTFDDATDEAAMWVNGVKATASFAGALDLTPGIFKVGGQVKTFKDESRWWRGAVDEVAFWDRALSDAEVAAHYGALVAGPLTLSPSESFAYDRVGNLVSRTSRRGYTTEFVFDDLNRGVKQVDPLLGGEATRGETVSVFDPAGNVLSTTDPRGAVREFSYDMLNRVRTETDVVNGPSGVERFTWTYGYDDLGNRVTTQDPAGGTASAVFNEASEQTSVIDQAGETTVFGYDLAGRVIAVTDPDGVTVESGFDLAGRLVESRQVPAGAGTVLVTGYGYNPAGNVTSVTSPRGYTTTTQYDALGRPVGVSQPVSATEQVVTGYGFDAAGNLTRVTDGRGGVFEYGYNSWNLQETVTEPATTQHPATGDREWEIGYDAGGLAVAEAQPGGVLITRQFDTLGRMTTETGTGVGVAAASRRLSFDKGGLLTGVSHPGGDLVYGFDERGLITTASGPAGTASYGYDGLGRVTSRTDDAGIHGFTWTARSELDTVADPITGLVFDYDWTAGGRVDAVTYGTSGMTRDYGYDGYGRLDTDELRDGATVLQGFSFGYDPDGNATSRSVTAPGNPQAGIHSYGYDRAGRLTSWTPPGAPQVTYGWDGSGNRVTAGSDSYVFDERNRLTSGPDGAYTYSPRGTLESVGAVSYSFDALGRLVDYDSQAAFTYDGLDRVATRNTDTFTYAGMWIDPTTDGAFTYSRTPAGRLVSQTDGVDDWLFGQDRHGDVTALINPTTASVTDTRLYDPFGDVAAQTGTTNPTLGFQGDYTDPASDEVWMGARWYSGADAVFRSRDAIFGELAMPISLNRYTYAAANPLRYWALGFPRNRGGFLITVRVLHVGL